MEQKYRGKFCWMERPEAYDSGEYYIIEESPNALYGIKPVCGYGGHELKSFPMHGAKMWTVVSSYSDEGRAIRLASELIAFDQDKGEKPNWIGSVYAGCRAHGEKILRDMAPAVQAVEFATTVETLTLTFSDGTQSKFYAERRGK